MLKEEWSDCNLYIEIQKIFFVFFPTKLYKWITKLANSQGKWKLDDPIVWNPKLVWRLDASEDKIAHSIDHWIDHIIGGFINEFTVNTFFSYNEAERCFLKGPQGKYVKYLNTWITILLCEKRDM